MSRAPARGEERSVGWASGHEGGRGAVDPAGRQVPGAAALGVDGPRPRERTCSPKEADVRREERRRAGDRFPRPFLGRPASRLGPRDAPSWHVASRRSSPLRAPGAAGMTGVSDDPGRPGDGPVAVPTLLASDPPRPPAGGVRDPEGVAFTAVSPFY